MAAGVTVQVMCLKPLFRFIPEEGHYSVKTRSYARESEMFAMVGFVSVARRLFTALDDFNRVCSRHISITERTIKMLITGC